MHQFWIGDGVDLIIGPGNVDFHRLLPILYRLAVVTVGTAAAQWLMNLCNNQISFRVVNDLRVQAFSNLSELPIQYIDTKQYGEIISRITTDVDQFSDGLLMGFSQLFTGVMTIIGTLGFMLTINIPISLVVAPDYAALPVCSCLYCQAHPMSNSMHSRSCAAR